MRILAVPDETYCIKTHVHKQACKGKNHVCYRCGMYLGGCRCPKLGTLLDY